MINKLGDIRRVGCISFLHLNIDLHSERMDLFMARNNHFGGFGGGANMQQLMRQAQKLQEQMTKAQEELDEREYSAQAGGGMVTVTVTGKRENKSLEIKPECVDPDDVEMLHDLILAAVNEALRVAEETRNNEMSKLAPGMGGMF